MRRESCQYYSDCRARRCPTGVCKYEAEYKKVDALIFEARKKFGLESAFELKGSDELR